LSTTKAAVETLTNIFAKELRGRDIAVNAIAPGPTAAELFLNDKTPEQIEHLAKVPPMERLAQPEDMANVVAFLVGPDAGWVDGQTLRVNGGMV
jgi:3-oxoacyl-[acyl-carrier protein] reductase